MTRALLFFGALALGGCSAGTKTVAIDNAAAAKQAVGKRVRIEGMARNAKLAAVVVHGDLIVYCLDHDSWPADLDGKKVAAQGTLEYTGEFQAKTSPSGEVSQGTGGKVFVLRTSDVRSL
jgi:hypothetical protein